MNKADAQGMVDRISNAGHTATIEELRDLNGPTGVWRVVGRAADAATGVTLNAAKTLQDGTVGVVGTIREVIYI